MSSRCVASRPASTHEHGPPRCTRERCCRTGVDAALPGPGDPVPVHLPAGDAALLDASIQTLAYVIMALGLNIVVGFAGLLDLGYVAFYAIGAFVIGWFGSQQFPDVNGGKGIHILGRRSRACGTTSRASTSTSSSSSSSRRGSRRCGA